MNPPARATRARLTAPLAHRDFRLLWTGLVVSLVGDGVFLVAVAWQAYAIADRPSALAAVALCASLSQIALLPLGGVISDRLSRRTVLLVSDLARGVALAALAGAGWTGHLALWHLCVAAAVIGAGTAFAAPAFDAVVPDLVPDRDLQQANGLDQVIRPLSLRLLGPMVGGVLIAAAGTSGAFAVDAVSFAVSAWCVARMTLVAPPADAAGAVAGSLWADVREGASYVRAHVWLWGTFASATITYLLFLGPTEVLLPYLVRNQLHGSARDLGLVLGSGGLGALAAATVTGRRTRVGRPVTFMYLTWAGATLAVAGYGVVDRHWQLAVAAVVVNGLEAAGTVVWATLKQRLVPRELLGRVSSIDWLVSTALMPVSYALTPVAASVFGVRGTLVGAGIIGACVTSGFLFLPGMRAPDRAFQDPPAHWDHDTALAG